MYICMAQKPSASCTTARADWACQLHRCHVLAGAKLGGAVVGVAIGCLLGLTPLFWSGTFFVHTTTS